MARIDATDLALLALVGAAVWMYLAADSAMSVSSSPAPDAGSSDLDTLIAESAARYGVDPQLVHAIVQTESGGNSNAQSSASSARGLMQLTRAAASDVGADYDQLFDPAVNIDAGTHYLANLISQFGPDDGVRAYYAGPAAIESERATGQRNAGADRYLASVLGVNPGLV